MTHSIIQELTGVPVYKQKFEIVERKGKGHPDTICDAIAEHVSVRLTQTYEENFGRILHYNIDKCLLVAGQVDCHLGGGRVRQPMRLILGDRATFGVGRKKLPISQIVTESAREWFQRNLPHLHPDKHVDYQIELKPTSAELGAIFDRTPGPLPANDTSAAVGYAPLTPTERLVISFEHYLNGSSFKSEFPETGEDVKVMAVRLEEKLSLTVAMPFLAKAILSEKSYFKLKKDVLKTLNAFVHDQPHAYRQIDVTLNALDRANAGVQGMYLTLLGTSAEHGDSGQVGRGNRVNGVITVNRPMSGEAAAGKNSVSHVGKIYNVLAHDLAARVYQQVPGLEEVTIWLVSTIGQKVNRPMAAIAQVVLKAGVSLSQIRREIEEIIQNALDNIGPFCASLAKGEYSVC